MPLWKLQIKYGVLGLKNIYRSFLFSLSFLLFSCTSIPPRGSFAGATIIGENSDVFIFVPVQHNKELLTKILPEHKYVKKALDKTNFLYLSLALKERKQSEKQAEIIENETIETSEEDTILEPEEITQESEEKVIQKIENEIPEDIQVIEEEEKNLFDLVSYDICAVGTYPTKLTQFFLTKKNGWIRKKGDDNHTYYKKEDEKAKSFSFFSIPTKDLVLFSYNTDNEGKMEEVLKRVNKPRPVYFDEDFEIAIQQGNPSNDICIFVSNSHFFLSKLLGINIDLPIESLKVYLTKDTSRNKEIYTYSIILEVKNLTASFATRLLLSKLLKTQVRVNGNKIIVEKAKVTSEKLVELIQKVIFK